MLSLSHACWATMINAKRAMRGHRREDTEEAQCKVSYKQILKDGQNFDNDEGKGKSTPSRGDKNKDKE